MSVRIFKVQRPLSSNVPLDTVGWLVYPRDRDPMFDMAPTQQMVDLMKGDVKMYVRAEASQAAGKETPDFTVLERVEDQPW